MASKNKKLYLLGLAVALLLPLSCFLYYNQDVDKMVVMPQHYVVDTVLDSKTGKDTIYHKISNLKLINQLGDSFNLNEDLKGKILVINFFFSRCPTICPTMSSNMKPLLKAFAKKSTELVHFVSISVDPKDSVQQLRAYADRFTSDHDRWYFAAGNQQEIFNFAKKELGLKLEAETPDEFIHSQSIVLVDTTRYIRGYYDAMEVMKTTDIANDIILLNLEKHKKK